MSNLIFNVFDSRKSGIIRRPRSNRGRSAEEEIVLRKILPMVLGALMGLAMLGIAPVARADEANQATQLVLSQPVQIPGRTVLPAGTYWFVLVDTWIGESNMVRIYNANRTHIIATLETITANRPEANGRTELVFAEQTQGRPLALLKWFYPDRTEGHEFIYSRRREAKLLADQDLDILAKTVS